jgi:hypothetical protein
MGYGGTGYATVDVDIVQTDVDAIVQGLTGYAGMTLSDVHGPLAYAVDLLSGYAGGPLTGIDWNTSNARDYLSGYNGGPLTDIREYLSGNWGGPLTTIAGNTWDMQDGLWQVRDYLSGYSYGPLTDIRDCLWADGYNAAWWMKEAAYRGSDISMYLSGGWNGPLTDIAWSNYEIRDQINGYSYGPLSDMRDRLSAIEGYLWSGYWGASAADLLGDIRDHLGSIRYQIDQLTFDGNGNLRVVTY